MGHENTLLTVRGLNFLAGVLENHSREPLCKECKSYAKTLEHAMEALGHFEQEGDMTAIPEEFRPVYESAAARIKACSPADELVPQRKIGACTFPEKMCIVKRALVTFREAVAH